MKTNFSVTLDIPTHEYISNSWTTSCLSVPDLGNKTATRSLQPFGALLVDKFIYATFNKFRDP